MPNAIRRLAWMCLLLLCLIGAGAAVRRMVVLVAPAQTQNGPAELVGLDAHFLNERLATFAHIVPAFVLVFIVPLQFWSGFRNRYLRIHRILGRIAMILGLVIALSGFTLLLHPVGGVTEIAAIICFGGFFLIALMRAWLLARRGEIDAHREWVIRAMGVALGVATVRPVMGIFFALNFNAPHGAGRTPADFFGPAFWIGFSATLLAAEAWVRATRVSKRVSGAST